MTIIADSGATQCTWIVTDGGRTETVRTQGINAMQMSEEQIAAVLAGLPGRLLGAVDARGCPEPDAVRSDARRYVRRDSLAAGTVLLDGEDPREGHVLRDKAMTQEQDLRDKAMTQGQDLRERKQLRNEPAPEEEHDLRGGNMPPEGEGLGARQSACATYAQHETVGGTTARPISCAEPAPTVRFYGAGCGPQFPEASERMVAVLREHFRTPHVAVHSDLLGAARALFGRGEGIACIFGTGSNSCHCRAGRIVGNVPPLGYILGDEGSGAALGRNLLNGIFKGHIPLREELFAATGLDYEGIIRRVYREPAANRFLASLAPFVREHLARPQVREMVAESFRDFARRNLTRYPAGLPVACVGGVAAHFAAPLREALAGAGYSVVRIEQSPAEGLIRYHHGQ